MKAKPLSFYWPNNRPLLFTEEQLAAQGKAIELEEPLTLWGCRPVWTIDVFGRHELHLLAPRPTVSPTTP